MQIRRTYKEKSLKFGQVEIVDEAKTREVFGQTDVAIHNNKTGYTCCKCPDKGPCACGRRACSYCAIPAMEKLLSGAPVETYFSRFELVAA